MNALTRDFDIDMSASSEYAPSLPLGTQVQSTQWGYILDGLGKDHVSPVRAIAARFFGIIFLATGVSLWLVPDALYGAGVFAMKMGAMVLFTVFGAVLTWYGRQRPGYEMQVDTHRSEVRLGTRSISGDFRLMDRLHFEEVRSVFLMRGETPGQPSRLFLRLGTDGHMGIEVARGTKDAMELVRRRLAFDLTR